MSLRLPFRAHAPELAIAAALGVLSMGFQLVASRILSPYFGSSIVVWAWLISTFLAAFSVGSLAGGWLAAGAETRHRWVAWLAVAAAGFLLFDAVLGSRIAAAVAAHFTAPHPGLPIVCIILFWPPVTALSCLGPILVARAAERGMRAGSASGLFAGASTAGNIAGVMITAFLLIPTIGSLALLYLWALAGSLTLGALVWRLRSAAPMPTPVLAPGMALLCVAGIGLSGVVHTGGARIAELTPSSSVTIDSVYNHLVVVKHGSIVSMQRTDSSSVVSAVDLADPQRQVLGYTGVFFIAAMMGPPPEKALQIGLGGGTFNQLFKTSWPGATLTSVEIDPAVRDVAVKYMAFKPDAHDVVEIADGRRYLAAHPGPWNWVILDAYIHGGQVQPHLRTVEFYREISRSLAPEGLVIDNLQKTQRLFAADVATLRAAFPQVLFFNMPASGNVVAVASNDKYNAMTLEQRLARADPGTLPEPLRAHLSFSDIRAALVPYDDPMLNQPATVLTDDFAPAEYLDSLPTRGN